MGSHLNKGGKSLKFKFAKVQKTQTRAFVWINNKNIKKKFENFQRLLRELLSPLGIMLTKTENGQKFGTFFLFFFQKLKKKMAYDPGKPTTKIWKKNNYWRVRCRDNCDTDDGRRTTGEFYIPWALLTESGKAKKISLKDQNLSHCHWMAHVRAYGRLVLFLSDYMNREIPDYVCVSADWGLGRPGQWRTKWSNLLENIIAVSAVI